MDGIVKLFSIKELEEVVEPYALLDVLNSLVFNMYLGGYSIDYSTDTVELQIPANVQIKEILDELSAPRTGNKPNRNDPH